jgi:hypothetical protein
MAHWVDLLGIFMGDNDFTGTLPGGLEAWSSVINFSLINTNITGTLPDTIGWWKNLIGFDVRYVRPTDISSATNTYVVHL